MSHFSGLIRLTAEQPNRLFCCSTFALSARSIKESPSGNESLLFLPGRSTLWPRARNKVTRPVILPRRAVTRRGVSQTTDRKSPRARSAISRRVCRTRATTMDALFATWRLQIAKVDLAGEREEKGEGERERERKEPPRGLQIIAHNP